MRASCEIYTIPGGGARSRAPPRTTDDRAADAADVTTHKQFVHPRVRRSNELAAASEMHPFCRRRAMGLGEGGPARVFLRVRGAVARIYIYVRTPISMQRGSFFELVRSRKTGERGWEKIYTIYVVFVPFFLAPWPNLPRC